MQIYVSLDILETEVYTQVNETCQDLGKTFKAGIRSKI